MYPLSVYAGHINSIDSSNEYLNNDLEKIKVISGLLTKGEYTFKECSIPYYITKGGTYGDLTASAAGYDPVDLIIEKGNTLLFEENAGIEVAGISTLKILGEPDAQVKLKGDEDLPNYWKGIFHNGLSTTNIIKNTIISGAASTTHVLDFKSSIMLGFVGSCCDRAFISLEDVAFENTECAIAQYGTKTTLNMENISYSNVENEFCN